MKILVNGASHDISGGELAAVLEELGYRDCVVTTALNGEFVATAVRARTRLRDGDRLEVLAPMQGG
jgi:sulfur carrier protein